MRRRCSSQRPPTTDQGIGTAPAKVQVARLVNQLSTRTIGAAIWDGLTTRTIREWIGSGQFDVKPIGVPYNRGDPSRRWFAVVEREQTAPGPGWHEPAVSHGVDRQLTRVGDGRSETAVQIGDAIECDAVRVIRRSCPPAVRHA